MFNFKKNKNENNNVEYNDSFDNYFDNEDTLPEEDYIQIEFNTDPEPEIEEINETIDEDNLDNNTNEEELKDYFEQRYILEADLQKALKEVSESKDKTIRKSVLISTIISSLVTASAFGGYYHISKNNSNTPTEIIVNGEGKSTNVYKAVATKCTPSVVGITTLTIDTNNFFSFPMQSEGVGSGVIVDKNGYILTNSHVVDDGKATKVSVMFADGTSSDGKVLWNDSTLDLAIVKVDKKNLDVAELGDSDEVEVGDLAIAIGNPIGLELNKTVTQGIISGKDRSLATNKGSMTGLLQTDASINPGNSGGPLLNDKGEVIGINTAKLSDTEGLGFAIPINIAKPIVQQIINKGDFEKVSMGIKGVDVANVKAYLGVDLSVEEGVYVIEITSGTPANNAGIKTGDVITSIDNNEITSMSDLNKALYQYRKGDSAKVKIIREGKETILTVNFSKQVSTKNNIEQNDIESNNKSDFNE